MRIRAKGRKLVIWMGMAIDATSRLWLAGVVSVSRDRQLADRLLQQVRRCCQCVQGVLICTDGWNGVWFIFDPVGERLREQEPQSVRHGFHQGEYALTKREDEKS